MHRLVARALAPARAPLARGAAAALALALACSALAASASTAAAPAGAESDGRPGSNAWFTSWAASQQNLASTPLRDQSVRMITHLSQGGDAVRIRVQNTFGEAPLTVDAATVAHSDGEDAATEGRPRAVTFDGRRRVVVPPGGEVWSDATAFGTGAQDDIAVSLSVSGTVAPGRHDSAFRTNYLTPPGSGDHTADRAGTAFTETTGSTLLVSAVDVRNPGLRGSLVAYGSSVVDGTGSTDCGPGCSRPGADLRWTDDLARRITSELPPRPAVRRRQRRHRRHHQRRDLPGHRCVRPRPRRRRPAGTRRPVPARGHGRPLLLRDQRPPGRLRRRADRGELPRGLPAPEGRGHQGVRHAHHPPPGLHRPAQPPPARRRHLRLEVEQLRRHLRRDPPLRPGARRPRAAEQHQPALRHRRRCPREHRGPAGPRRHRLAPDAGGFGPYP